MSGDFCVMELESGSDGFYLNCKGCNRKMTKWVGEPQNVVRKCKGITGRTSVVTSWKQHRPRTDDEMKAIRPICKACPHYLHEPTETLDAGVCLLRTSGCSACTSLEKFLAYLRVGYGCADEKNARFPATELVEIGEVEQSATAFGSNS